MANEDDLLKRHKVSIGGIFRNGYTIEKILNSFVFKFCIVLSVLFGAGLLYFNREADRIYVLIDDLSSTVLSAFPSLLGFSLAGYALIIGASDLKLIERMSEPLKSNKERLSYFQTTSCVFASSVLIQCATLILAFCVHIVVKMKLPFNNETICCWLNFVVFVVLLFAVLFSMLLLCSTVVNLFTYGQSIHLCVRLDKELANNEEENLWKEIKDSIYKVIKKYLSKYE